MLLNRKCRYIGKEYKSGPASEFWEFRLDWLDGYRWIAVEYVI